MNYIQPYMAQSISYIVSTYHRPELLDICLCSLKTQTHKNSEIIVTDNSEDPVTMAKHKESADRYGARYMNTRALTCYHSAEMGARTAVGKWLCFPSDDSYYVPKFAEKLLEMAYEYNLDFAFCEMVHNEAPLPPHQGLCIGTMDSAVKTGYRVRNVQPRLGFIDKTGFIVRRDVFAYFPRKPDTALACGSDGYLIEWLKKAGARYKKHDDVLVVHN